MCSRLCLTPLGLRFDNPALWWSPPLHVKFFSCWAPCPARLQDEVMLVSLRWLAKCTFSAASACLCETKWLWDVFDGTTLCRAARMSQREAASTLTHNFNLKLFKCTKLYFLHYFPFLSQKKCCFCTFLQFSLLLSALFFQYLSRSLRRFLSPLFDLLLAPRCRGNSSLIDGIDRQFRETGLGGCH